MALLKDDSMEVHYIDSYRMHPDRSSCLGLSANGLVVWQIHEDSCVAFCKTRIPYGPTKIAWTGLYWPTPNKSVHSTAWTSKAWDGPGSWHRNGSGFTIATVWPGPLLQLMLQDSSVTRGGGPASVTPDWREWLTLLVSRSRGRSYFPVNQLIGLQCSVLLAVAPAPPSHSRDWTVPVPGAGGTPL